MGQKADKLFGRPQSASDNLRIWQIKFLEDMAAAVSPAGGLATESTLISVLNAIIASDQDIEILLVRDTGNGNKVVQQITNYETGVPVVTYKDVNGADYIPVGPLEYLDPSAILNLILTQITVVSTPVTGVTTSLDIITGAGAANVPAGKRTISFLNSGNNNANVNGSILKKGIGITYPELSNRDLYGSIPYDALTSELTITTVS